MAFWRCYYHIVWATKGRAAILTPELEQVIVQSATEKSLSLECPLHALNGTEDHIHVAVSIPPRVSVAEWVRNIKGITAHEINDQFPNLDSRFRWQRGYGVLTFGAKLLPIVCEYISNQKEHHRQNSIQPYLEQVDEGIQHPPSA